MTALGILAIVVACLLAVALPIGILHYLDPDDPSGHRRAAIGQARRDVLGETHGKALWGWGDLDMHNVSNSGRGKLQKVYADEVDRLTEGRVSARVNNQLLNDLSNQTKNAVKRHQEALKELGH